MKDITLKSSKEIIALICKREISCEELMKACLAQITKYDPVLEAFISLYDEDLLLEQARVSDRRRGANSSLSLIDGIPVAVKDNMHSMGIPTTCASKDTREL